MEMSDVSLQMAIVGGGENSFVSILLWWSFTLIILPLHMLFLVKHILDTDKNTNLHAVN